MDKRDVSSVVLKELFVDEGVIHHHIAIDPGKITGWARTINGEFMSGQAPLMEILDWIWIAVQVTRPELYCEDFIITGATAKKSRQTDPMDGIGALKWMAHKQDLNLIMQAPASAKSFATDDKLKRAGWYNGTKGGHANDAARHLMLGMAGKGLLDLSQLKET